MPLRMNDPRRAARCYLGDCLTVLPTLAAESVDAVVTDPPAGIKFMGVGWDSFANRKGAKGHDRSITFNRVGGNHNPVDGFDRARTARSEGAKFRAWLTPILAECLRVLKPGGYALVWALPRTSHWTGTAIEDAGFEMRDRISHLQSQGFPKGKGCLKPACEDWWLARKPGPRVLPLNIEGSRVPGAVPTTTQGAFSRIYGGGSGLCPNGLQESSPHLAGRWPANVCLSCDCPEGDGHASDCPVALLDAQAGERKGDSPGRKPRLKRAEKFGWSGNAAQDVTTAGFTDSGGPSRFLYVAKASKRDRGADNRHPTVKSQALMKWLVGLVSFPGETVLDPFMGSGTTGVACIQTGRKFVGIELDPEYHAIATCRIAQAETEALANGTSTKE